MGCKADRAARVDEYTAAPNYLSSGIELVTQRKGQMGGGRHAVLWFDSGCRT